MVEWISVQVLWSICNFTDDHNKKINMQKEQAITSYWVPPPTMVLTKFRETEIAFHKHNGKGTIFKMEA